MKKIIVIPIIFLMGLFFHGCPKAIPYQYTQENTYIKWIPSEDFTYAEVNIHYQNARSPWKPMEVLLKTGDKINVIAKGEWCVAPNSCYPPEGNKNIILSDVEVKDLPLGALIGRIDNDKPFFIGSNRTFQILKNGSLKFTINNSHKLLNNNRGELYIEIRIKRASSTPEIKPITKYVIKPDGKRAFIALLTLDTGPGVSKTSTSFLTDILGNSLVSTGAFRVLDRKNMDAILNEQGFQMSGCTSSECAVEIGRLLSVEYMVSGSVGKMGTTYVINVQIVNVETGEVEGSALDSCNCQEGELPAKIQQVATKLAAVPLSKSAE